MSARSFMHAIKAHKWQAHGYVHILIRHQQCPITLLSGHPSVHSACVHN